jgi:pimeloyl-ACP methyl ester carboxylesterase
LRAIAQEGVRPAAVILESPFDRLLTTVRNRFRVMGLPSFPSAELMVFWGSVQHGFNGFDHNPADYAAAVQCPALVLHGDQDTRATTAEARAVYDRLAGPKQFVDFPGAGHDVPVAGEAQAWQAPVARFLERLPTGP